MKYRRRVFFTDKQKSEIWDRWQREASKRRLAVLRRLWVHVAYFTDITGETVFKDQRC